MAKQARASAGSGIIGPSMPIRRGRVGGQLGGLGVRNL